MTLFNLTLLLVSLAALTVFDIKSRRLPNLITIPLAIYGAIFALVSAGLVQFTIVAATGIASFALLAALATAYRHIRGRQGLGMGDAKLVAAAGTWLGPASLAPMLLTSTLLALAFAAVCHLRGATIGGSTTLPFGPFLSAAFLAFWTAQTGLVPSLLGSG